MEMTNCWIKQADLFNPKINPNNFHITVPKSVPIFSIFQILKKWNLTQKPFLKISTESCMKKDNFDIDTIVETGQPLHICFNMQLTLVIASWKYGNRHSRPPKQFSTTADLGLTIPATGVSISPVEFLVASGEQPETWSIWLYIWFGPGYNHCLCLMLPLGI